MAAVTYYPKVLEDALTMANSESEHQVECYKSTALEEPIYLRIRGGDNIGITHLVHLQGEEWKTNERTVEEVAESIKKAVELHFQYKGKEGVLMTPVGTIFVLNGQDLKIIGDGLLAFGERVVTYGGRELPADAIKAEGIITVRSIGEGKIDLENEVDQRSGCGIFIGADGVITRG